MMRFIMLVAVVALLQASADAASEPYDYGLGTLDWAARECTWCNGVEGAPVNFVPGSAMPLPAELRASFHLPIITNFTFSNRSTNVDVAFDVISASAAKKALSDGGSMPNKIYPYGTMSFKAINDTEFTTARYVTLKSVTSVFGPYTGYGPSNGACGPFIETGIEPSCPIGAGDEPIAGVTALPATLIDIHWHVPAEHTFDGTQHDAEIHFVNLVQPGDDDPACIFEAAPGVVGCLFVIGVVYDSNSSMDPASFPIWEAFTTGLYEVVENDTSHVVSEMVDLAPAVPADAGYYTYRGGRTTPDCNENVTFNILSEVHPIPSTTMELLAKSIMGGERAERLGNARPVQPLNDRCVFISEATARAQHPNNGPPASAAPRSHPAGMAAAAMLGVIALVAAV